MTKTNVLRLLEAAGIPFGVVEYEYDESDLSGATASKKAGLPPEKMFKTLVFRGEKNGIGVCCIPVMEELDLKKAARVFGEKKIEMLHVKELLPTTGYIRGGCSPIGMKKKFPTVIDESALLSETISVSAGVRGEMVTVEPEALAEFVGARFEDIIVV